MGSSNSVPEKIQGTYIEKFKTEQVDNKYTEFSYKLTLKETEFELVQTQINNERKPEGGGGSFKIVKMALLTGTLEKSDDSKNENEMTFAFKSKKASFQEGGGMMGVPLPDDSHKVDFSMKYTTMMRIDPKTKTPEGSFHNLAFVTYPKLKFDELTGNLTKS